MSRWFNGGRIVFPTNGLGHLDRHIQKNEARPLLHTIIIYIYIACIIIYIYIHALLYTISEYIINYINIIIALFISWKVEQPKCPLTNEQIKSGMLLS